MLRIYHGVDGCSQFCLTYTHERARKEEEDLQMPIFIWAAQKLVRGRRRRRSLIIIGEHLTLAEKSTTNCKKCIQSHSFSGSQRVDTMRNLVRSWTVILVQSLTSFVLEIEKILVIGY